MCKLYNDAKVQITNAMENFPSFVPDRPEKNKILEMLNQLKIFEVIDRSKY